MSPIHKLIHLSSRAGLFLVAVGANAGTLHVPALYPTIQAAIDAAVSGQDEVVVADGTYIGAGNRDLDFSGKAITVRSAGGPLNCIINCESAGRAFHFHSGESAASRVTGFTVLNGLAVTGSAILCELGSGPTITNCVFTANEATAVDNPGGALACLTSSPTIDGCIFQANTTTGWGGAAMLDGSDAEFTDCRFEGNSAFYGGAAECYNGGYPVFTDCRFEDNTAGQDSGAIDMYLGSSATLTRCVLGNNHATQIGGISIGYQSIATLTDCLFVRNESDTCCGAGAVHQDSSAQLTRCAFLGNVASGPTQGSGGLAIQHNSQADIRDCVFIGNRTPDHGGGIVCADTAELTLTNSTFCSNVAGAAGGPGAVAIYRNTNGMANLQNSTLWNNGPLELRLFQATATVTYSDIRNGWPGTGNISADPRFVRNPAPGEDGVWGTPDDDYGDLHLTLGSPCIDAGDPAFAPPCAHDLDHACRVWDGNSDSLARVDMGAYEFRAARGDLNGDCEVGLSDLAALLAHFGTPTAATHADGDLDADGDVDLSDLATLLANFGATCP